MPVLFKIARLVVVNVGKIYRLITKFLSSRLLLLPLGDELEELIRALLKLQVVSVELLIDKFHTFVVLFSTLSQL